MSSDRKEFKIVVIGSRGVGKSALTVRLVTGHFVEFYDPTIEDSYRKVMEIDGNECCFDILDTAGAEEPNPMMDYYIKLAHGIVIVYDITRRESFGGPPQDIDVRYVDDFVKRIRAIYPRNPPPIALCGNKCDLESDRQVQTEEGQAKADEIGCLFFETSAKTGMNVKEAFESLYRQSSFTNDNASSGSKHCIIM